MRANKFFLAHNPFKKMTFLVYMVNKIAILSPNDAFYLVVIPTQQNLAKHL